MIIDEIKKLGLSIKKYNGLSTEDKFKINKPFMFDPFDSEIKNKPMINPVSLKLFNNWEDGIHYLINTISLDIIKKIEIKNNVVVKAYEYNQNTFRFNKIKLNS